MVAAVIGGRPGRDDFGPTSRGFKDSPYIKGIRHIPRGDRPASVGDGLPAGVRLLGELGMSFRPVLPPQGCRRRQARRRLPGHCGLVLDHCGNADPLGPSAGRRQGCRGQSAPPSHDPDQWAPRHGPAGQERGWSARARESWPAPTSSTGTRRPGPDHQPLPGRLWPDRGLFARLAGLHPGGPPWSMWSGRIPRRLPQPGLSQQRKLFADTRCASTAEIVAPERGRGAFRGMDSTTPQTVAAESAPSR